MYYTVAVTIIIIGSMEEIEVPSSDDNQSRATKTTTAKKKTTLSRARKDPNFPSRLEILATVLLGLFKKISSEFLNNMEVHHSLKDLHQFVKNWKTEFDLMSQACSQEDLLNWSKMQKDELLYIMEQCDVSQLHEFKVSLIKLAQLPISPAMLNSLPSYTTPREATKSMQSTIAPFLTGHADVSMDSFLDEKQKTKIYTEKRDKETSEMSSTIIWRNGDASCSLKSDMPNSSPNYLLRMSLVNVQEVIQKNIPANLWWKHTTLSMNYYGMNKTLRGQSILTYAKIIEQFATEKLEKNKSKRQEESI